MKSRRAKGDPGTLTVIFGHETHTSRRQSKQQFRIGDSIEGVGVRVVDPRLEIADIYRVSKLKILRRGGELNTGPPWHGVPAPLPVYRARGHRRLATAIFESQCQSYIWGCAMPVEIIVDH